VLECLSVSYATYDFTESLDRVALKPADIAMIVAAWGIGDGQGEDAGHYRWSDDGVTEWSGGFLMRLNDGRFAYVTGWCDFTGWGCQDGAEITYYDAQPSLDSLKGGPAPDEWDHEPADLNRWLTSGARDRDTVDVTD